VDFIKDPGEKQATPTSDTCCQSTCDKDHTHHPATSDDPIPLRISPGKHSPTTSAPPPPAPPPPPPPPQLDPSTITYTTWMMKQL